MERYSVSRAKQAAYAIKNKVAKNTHLTDAQGEK